MTTVPLLRPSTSAIGSAGLGNANEATTRVGKKAVVLPADAHPWPRVRVARCRGTPGPVGYRLRRVLAIHAAHAGGGLLAPAAARQ